MIDIAPLAKARARTRRRIQIPRIAPVRPAPARQRDEAAKALAAGVAIEVMLRVDGMDDNAPFDPPDDADVFGATEFEEAPATRFDPEIESTIAPIALVAPEEMPEPAAEPEMAPPPLLQAIEEEPLVLEDEAPPFDAPDVVENSWVSGAPAAEPEPLVLTAPAAPQEADLSPPPRDPGQEPVPPIRILAVWDRPEAEKLFAACAADARLKRAQFSVERGGLQAAFEHCANAPPHLLLIESTLNTSDILNGVAQLADAMKNGMQVLVVGGLNDVLLLRGLKALGVSEYVMAPVTPADLARRACVLFARDDNGYASRVIAVIGARGGVGASTIAHNLAWSIAERQDQGVTLIDMDLAFGASAHCFEQTPEATIEEAMFTFDVDDALIERLSTRCGDKLALICGPTNVTRSYDIYPQSIDLLLSRVRRTNPYVVLDLPHAWEPWVRQALLSADDIVVAAAPDLASLRNTKAMLDYLANQSAKCEPLVVLSMLGAPKRPEIPVKDFGNAAGTAPVAQFAFDPALYGAAFLAGRMLGEIAPQSKAAVMMDALATALTGCPAVKRKKPRAAKAMAPVAAVAPKQVDPPAMLEVQAGAEPPLELSAPLPSETPMANVHPIRRHRAARPELIALANAHKEAAEARRPAPKHASPLVRAASVAVLLFWATAYYAQNQSQFADAAEPPRAHPVQTAPPELEGWSAAIPVAAPAPSDTVSEAP